MAGFGELSFHGKFRDYQQSVLDVAQKHLRDGKLHIVAAPGSGKTVLGLELIRRLSAPALVLSPSVTIRQQWGERLCEKFLPECADPSGYISYDLKAPALITSVTYQALHAAVSRAKLAADDGEDETPEDFAAFDLFAMLRRAGVRTVCLDEAHHLKSEWQKALEAFIEALRGSVTVISLTATPPYDSTPAEWDRYISLCGEIDEEIFVAQLVAQKTLCPHQDYVYIGYPTEDEAAAMETYRQRAEDCVQSAAQSGLLARLVSSRALRDASSEDILIKNAAGVCALLSAAAHFGTAPDAALLNTVSYKKKLPPYGLSTAEAGFQFVLDSPGLFGESAEALRVLLSENGLVERKKVCLVSNDRLDRQLISSIGKLKSIDAVVNAEYDSLGGGLRMLILTDYIKKDLKKLIGTDEPITSMGTVPIFESVRRSCRSGVMPGMLAGTMVIVPDGSVRGVADIAAGMGAACTAVHIDGCAFTELRMGSNKSKVAVLTAALQQGLINVLIGTKSLLGEGWDAPCVNSLILASFVGSFMLSNQMRGRAIRTDVNAPQKASNIWHLVTLPADGDARELTGEDYASLCRRFDCFVAPAYHYDAIESGIDRIDVLTPPFDREGVERINRSSLAFSADRGAMAKRWTDILGDSGKTEMLYVCDMPREALPRAVTVRSALLFSFWLALSGALAPALAASARAGLVFVEILCAAALAACGIVALVRLARLVAVSSPRGMAKAFGACVLGALRAAGEIGSSSAKLFAADEGARLCCGIRSATVHEKSVFTGALCELLTRIGDPRYVFVKRGFAGTDCTVSFACPAVLGAKKETAERLLRRLEKLIGRADAVYTRSPAGARVELRCIQRSYLNRNGCISRSKKRAG